MPPNSVVEWMIGQNIPRKKHRTRRRELLKVELSTDDESDTDTISLTYPRTSSLSSSSATRKSAIKKVRFGDKSIKVRNTKSGSTTSKSSTATDETPEIEDSSEDGELEYDSGSSKSSRQAKAATEKKKGKTPKGGKCKKDGSSSTVFESSDDDAIPDPHPTCPCAECITGRKELKKLGKLIKAGKKGKFTDTSGETEESEASLLVKKQDLKSKQKAKQTAKHKSSNEDSASEESSDKPVSKSPTKQSKNGGDKKSNKGAKQSGKKAKSDKNKSSAGGGKSAKKSQKSKEVTLTKAPNLIMPVRAQVVQVEHAVETADDPRPNSFFDNEQDVCRVYHGPLYGNPYGSLYPRWTGPNASVSAGNPYPLYNQHHYNVPLRDDRDMNYNSIAATGYVPPAPNAQFSGKPDGWKTGQGSPRIGLSGMPAMPLSPRTIAARFSASPPSEGKTKNQMPDNNVGPTKPPSHRGFMDTQRTRWSDNRRSSGGAGGYGGNDGGNDAVPGITGSNHSGSNRSANRFDGPGWGADVWESNSAKGDKTSPTNNNNTSREKGWGSSSAKGDNDNNKNDSGWTANTSPPKQDNTWGGGGGGSGRGWGGSNTNKPSSPNANDNTGGWGGSHHSMPGSWHQPNNNAGPTGGGFSHNSPRQSHHSAAGSRGNGWGAGGSTKGVDPPWGGGSNGGADKPWGSGSNKGVGDEGEGWTGAPSGGGGGGGGGASAWDTATGGGGGDSWADPSAAQSTQPNTKW